MLSDNFYMYEGYPDSNKWELHDPHNCIGRWAGRQPGLFIRNNIWVQREREGKFGGLLISANGYEMNTSEHHHIFGKAIPCLKDPKPPMWYGYRVFTTGMISGRRLVKYGYFEVKAKTMPTQLVNSFWLSQDHGNVRSEIDVFENAHVSADESKEKFDSKSYTVGNAFSSNISVVDLEDPRKYFVKPKLGLHQFNGGAISDEWHTYGLLWTKKRIVWFFNGHPYTSIDNTHWHYPLRVRFDVETNLKWHGVVPEPKELVNDTMQFIVHYFRAWAVPNDY